jgi:hypothetical protein
MRLTAFAAEEIDDGEIARRLLRESPTDGCFECFHEPSIRPVAHPLLTRGSREPYAECGEGCSIGGCL